MTLHKCEPEWVDMFLWSEGIDLHGITVNGYGPAITSCSENEKGEFWVGNDEYSTRVNFCPFCGEKAPNPFVGSAGG